MHVLFVAPHFPANQRAFVRALAAEGARVTGIGEADPSHLDDELRGWLHGWERVHSVTDAGALYDAVKRVQARGWVDRLETTVEAHILPTAQVREACTIPGLSVRAATLCRDKPIMKDFLREAGVRCARTVGVEDTEAALKFAAEIGYPLVVKPRASAGADGTLFVHDEQQLRSALATAEVGHGGSAALEEMIQGHEGFYDTLVVNGTIVHDFVCHYYPNVLEAMRTRWISPQIVLTNRMDAAGYKPLYALGQQVVAALGLGTTATHMEWFSGDNGLYFSEIGARPPGVRTWDMYSAGNGIDLYREWARAIVHGTVEERPSRQNCVGLIALRPSGDGRITHYDGVDVIQGRMGAHVMDCHLPEPGTPTQPVEAGYMANAWVRMMHPDYDTLRGMLDEVGRTLKVHAR